jgi:hypothetical protein
VDFEVEVEVVATVEDFVVVAEAEVEEIVKDFGEAVEVEAVEIVKDFEAEDVVEIAEATVVDLEAAAGAEVEEIVKKEAVSEVPEVFQGEVSEEVIVETLEVTGVLVEAGLTQAVPVIEVPQEVAVEEEHLLSPTMEERVQSKSSVQAKKKKFTRKNLKSNWDCKSMLPSRKLQLLLMNLKSYQDFIQFVHHLMKRKMRKLSCSKTWNHLMLLEKSLMPMKMFNPQIKWD